MDTTEKISAAVLKALRDQPVATWDGRDDDDDDGPDDLSLGFAHAEGAFRQLGLVAEGGQGEVHLARDESLRRHVALKQLSPSASASSRQRQRFDTEAQVTAQLEHPHIVPVYGRVADVDGRPGYAMKLVQGRTLGQWLHDLGPIPRRHDLPRLLEAFLKVCDALSYAHDRGVVHRDLKPDNVMVGAHGEVYVMDWGLASVRGQTGALDVLAGDEATAPGTALGTAMYMAPEQAGGAATVTAAADQYALGLVLYEMLCRRPPRSPHGSQMERLVRASQGERRAIRPAQGDRPPRELAAIVDKATQRRPERRYASVADLAADVRRYLDDRPVQAAPDGLRHGAMRWLSRNRPLTLFALSTAALMGVTAVAAIAVAGSSGVAVYQWSAEAEAAQWRQLTARVEGRANDLDYAMARIAGQLEAIDAAAGHLLVHGAVDPTERVVRPADFADPARRPDDTAHSTQYDRPLSTRWPASLVAPDGDAAVAAEELQRLAPLRHTLRRAHLTLRRELEGLSDAEADTAWRDRDGPIRWTFVGTQSGAYLDLPGAAWDPGDFDPRRRPWYLTGRRSDGPAWGRPYPEASTGSLLLPCTAAIRSSTGQLLGVAAIDVAFSYLIDRYLGVDDPAVTEVLLVDASGRVVARSSAVGDGGRPTHLGTAHETPPYAHAAHLTAPSGAVDLPDGTTRLIHRRLRATGWTYVAEVDRARVGG